MITRVAIVRQLWPHAGWYVWVYTGEGQLPSISGPHPTLWEAAGSAAMLDEIARKVPQKIGR